MNINKFVEKAVEIQNRPACKNIDSLCKLADDLHALEQEFSGFNPEDRAKILAML